jgi:hypothetical protein
MKADIEKSNRKVHRDAVDRMGQGLNDKHCNAANEASALDKPLNMWAFAQHVTTDHTTVAADFTYCDLYYIHPYYSHHI